MKSLGGIFKARQRLIVTAFSALLFQGCGASAPDVAELSTAKPAPVSPSKLRINEGFTQPLGFYDAKPNFSWLLPSDVQRQSQYQIAVASNPQLLPNNADLWQGDITSSNQSQFIEYQGQPLGSRQKVYWQVRIWDETKQASSWSPVNQFEMGLLENADWSAKWIEIDMPAQIELNQYKTPIHVPQHLRTEFGVTQEQSIKQARLYVTAKGVFEAYINGQRVGDDILTPGYTPYKKRIETLTYDVTPLLNTQQNALGLQLAEGWYAGRFGPKRHWHKKLELTPKVLAQLEIEYVDGSRQVVVTDDGWRATQQGPVRTSGLYDGERYDANFELEDQHGSWHQVGYDDTQWLPVKTSNIEAQVALQPKRHFTSKNIQRLPSLSIKQVQGKTVFDLGQNMVGVPHIKVPMKKGQTLNLRFAEGVNPDGSLFTKNLGTAKQLDFYTAKQDGIVDWQPQFTFHGFRYVELSGFDSSVEPSLDWVEGVVQHTDFATTGRFNTSHQGLNQFQSNINWGLKGNFLDIPTDCPQRAERLGWTGDALAFANTSLYNVDSHGFWSAWMQSIREEQFDNHSIPVVVPNEVGNISQAGWSDAAVTIPWDVYWRVGDKQILLENYPMMTRWIKYHQTQLKDGISEMWTVGDWLQPYSKREDSRRGETDHSLISTAFYARSVELTRDTALVLGKSQDAAKYSALLDEIKDRFQHHFFASNGRLQVGEQTQTAYLLAIGFDLIDPAMQQRAVPHMLATFDAANGHLRTGFLGTPLIAPVLDKVGRADLVFDLVFKQTYPSWLYSVTQGATTVWERWDGFTHDKGFAKKAGSLNHYAYGAIGQWLYDRIAGISPQRAGYEHIRIAPLIPEQLQFATGEYHSGYGVIRSDWRKTQDGLTLEVTVPANTRATIEIPLVEYRQRITTATFANTAVVTQPLGQNVSVNGVALADSPYYQAVTLGTEKATGQVSVIEVPAGTYTIRVF